MNANDGLDRDKLNEMRRKILHLEIENARSKEYSNRVMINKIIEIVEEEDRRCF